MSKRLLLILVPALLFATTAKAQSVTATVVTGANPEAGAVNPVTNKIYVANFTSGNVTVIDGATNLTTTVAVGTHPSGAAVNPVTNKIYVANEVSNNVTVIDGTTNTTTTVTDPNASVPFVVAVNPVTNKIYVANNSSSNVTVIDGATNTTTTVATGTLPIGVAVNPVTNKIYVANEVSNNVTVIDGATNTTTTVAAGTNPEGIAVNPVTNKVYVANQGSANVTVIDGSTNTTTTVAAGTTPFAVAVNQVTNKIYVANQGSSNVTVIDGATNTTITVAAGTTPFVVAVNPVTNQIYVSNNGSNNVTVIDGATNNTATVGVGAGPVGGAVNPVTNKIYVANGSSNNVTVIDGATNATATVAAGSSPFFAALNPATNQIYVPNSGSNNVTVIDGATNATTTVAAGTTPFSVAVNAVTNKIYVGNNGSANVTVIDGATNATTTVAAGSNPNAVAVNPVTNKIYVANGQSANVTVIDGATNATTTVAVGTGPNPNSVAVNAVTNKIYVANNGSNNVTVIDGATNNTTTVAAGTNPFGVAVNAVTNKIYVGNSGGNNVTVIDGATNNTTTVAAGTAPVDVAVNPVTNKIYVANSGSANVTVIDGATNNTTTVATGTGTNFVAVNPVTNKIYVADKTSNNVTVIDGATNTTATVTNGNGLAPFAMAVNPVTNQIYAANNGSNNVTVITEQQVQPIPLATTITPLAGNQTTNPAPTFTFSASSTFAPTAPPVDALYFQFDTWQGPWTEATSTGGGGFSGTAPTLSLGTHILYAYATDGQDATLTATNSSSSSPLIGAISAYLFEVNPAAITLVSIAVTPANPSIAKGDTQQFTATGTFSDNSTQNLTNSVTWASATTTVATISNAAGSQGLASAVGTGTSTISAKQSGVTGSTLLTVTAPVLVSIAVTPANSAVFVAETEQFTAIGTLSDNSTQVLTNTATWASSKTAVATINATGLATGVAGGTTTISATQSGVTGSTTLTVAAGGTPPTFTSTTLPAGAVGVRYGADIQVTGGTQPYTFALTNGSSLPTGFTLVATSSGNVAAGHIFNNSPAATGTFTFGITVTDSTSPTPQTATATISLTIAAAPANTQASLLKGQYAALFRGTDSADTTAQANVASFNFDGKGNFTVLFDGNQENGNLQTQCTASGTYSVGADNRGLITTTTNGTCVTGSEGGGGGVFAFALGDVKNGVASTARFINFDDDDGNRSLGAGILRRQDPTAFTSASLAGTYVFGLTGQDPSLGRAVELALATFDNKLGITSGSFDANDNGTLTAGTLSGSYTAPDANGRSVLTVTILAGGGTFTSTSVIYIVSANEAFLLILDPTTTNLLLAGDGQRQFNPNSFGLNSLAGPDILSFRGTSSGGTSAGVGVLTATVVNNVGNFSIAADVNDGGNLKLGQVTTGTYTMASNGRGVVTGQSASGNVNVITYLIRPDRAFFIGEDSSNPPFGEIEPQVGAPFSGSPFLNNLFVGEDELVPNGNGDISGVALLAPSNVLNATIDQSHRGGDLTFGQSISLSYTVDSTGHFTVPQSSVTGGLTGYVISPFKVAFFDTQDQQGTSNHPQLIIAQSIPQPPGAASPAATTVNFATPVAVGSSAQSAPVTFTNAGVGPLTLQTLTNAADFSAAGTCVNSLPVVLAPGQTCQVIVTFAPGASTALNTPLSETITIATDAGNITITATGTATGPGVTITPSTTVNFGNQTVGTTSGAIVTTVTNSGNSALVIGNVALTGANTADFSLLNPAGACQGDSSISAGLSCTINVTFTPASATTFNAAVTLTDNATGSPQTITLTGTGTATGSVISITPSSTVNFGNQLVGTTSGAITTTVTNTGTQPITLTSVTLNPLPNTEAGTNPDGFTIVAGTGTCTNGTNLAASGGKCVLPVTFGPPATGAVSSTITLNDSAGSQVITLNGTGIAPTISLNPTSLSFSTAPGTTSAAQTVTVTNSGAAPLHIANVTLGGESPDDFAFVNGTTPCAKGTVVQPQATCTIGVDFTAPSQSTFNATLTVTSDASNGVQTIPLTGTGVVISITPPPGGSTTATTNPGGKAVFPLILSSTGLTGTATLTCSSPQASITCAVVPGTVALTPNGVTHAAIVVDTFCARLSPPDSAPRSTRPTAPWLITIVGLALLGSMALTKKRTLRLAMPLAALLLTGIFASSCGSPPKGPAGATPPGTYTLNITATVGQASSTISLTLIVQ